MRRSTGPGIALSLATVAVGAVLAFAVTASTPGISLPAVGVVLLVVGVVGFATVLYLDWRAREALRPPVYDGYGVAGAPVDPAYPEAAPSYPPDRTRAYGR